MFKIKLVVLAFLFVAISGCEVQNESSGFDSSIYSLITNPDNADGKFVSVFGYLSGMRRGLTEGGLYPNRDNAFYVDLDSFINLKFETEEEERLFYSKCGWSYVFISGDFEYSYDLGKRLSTVYRVVKVSEDGGNIESELCWLSEKWEE